MIQYPPWQNLIKDDSGKIIGKSGLIFEVLNQISHKLNFSYSVREPADGKWGVRSGAGEWNGMIRHRIYIQGVPKVSLDFVLVIFSCSGAHTEELVTFFQTNSRLTFGTPCTRYVRN